MTTRNRMRYVIVLSGVLLISTPLLLAFFMMQMGHPLGLSTVAPSSTINSILQATTSALQSINDVAVPRAVAAPIGAWAPDSVSVQLARGQTKSVTVAFVSTEAISNLGVRVVPELAPFVQVVPDTLSNIPAGSTVSLTIVASATATSTLGTFDGTIQLRQDGQPARTIPKPLPVSVKIGAIVTGALPGVTFLMPSGWSGQFSDSSVDLISSQTLATLAEPDAAEIPADLTVTVLGNPEELSVQDFVQETQDGWYTNYPQHTAVQIAGRDAMLVSNVGDPIDRSSAQVLFVSLPSGNILAIAIPSEVITPAQTTAFWQIVNSLQFQ